MGGGARKVASVKLTGLLAVVLVACASAPPAAPPPPPPACPPPPAPPPPPPSPAPAAKAGVDAAADQVQAALNAKDVKALTAMFNDAMKKAVPPERLEPMTTGIQEKKGRIVAVEREPGGDPRNATYRFKAERGDWQVKLNLDPDGKIGGLAFTEPAAPPPVVAKSTLPMGLPFQGQWLVFWGGDHETVNYHVKSPSQRRAADLVIVNAEGKSYKGDGKKNEDYFAYGKNILAVADGTVVQAIDGMQENAPGVMSPLMALGNSVVIEHPGPVFSMYAHLKTGSVKVKAGAKVKKGTVVGLCGNSGNTSEPHLHFQLQDGPLVDHSWGVEPIFANVSVTRGGTASTMKDYTWLKGDLVTSGAK
jgi:murein DD-endopeptidase MepM/ murein hydrolase activator NlpD